MCIDISAITTRASSIVKINLFLIFSALGVSIRESLPILITIILGEFWIWFDGLIPNHPNLREVYHIYADDPYSFGRKRESFRSDLEDPHLLKKSKLNAKSWDCGRHSVRVLRVERA
jgi:hypothetical protein